MGSSIMALMIREGRGTMTDLVTMARLNDQAVIGEAVKAFKAEHYMLFAKILLANRDLASRIHEAVKKAIGENKE